jgi:hypothetical protein
MKRVALIAVIALLCAPAAMLQARADVAGKWSGSMALTLPDGQSRDGAILMDLKQTGNDLTGTAGPSVEQSGPVKGKVDGDKVAFDLEGPNGLALHFTLVLADGHLKGDMSADIQGMKMSGKVDVTRVK